VVDDPAAVVADRPGDAVEPTGAEPDRRAAPAVADDPDRAASSHGVDRRLQIGEHLLGLQLVDQLAAALDVLRLVAELELGLDAIEERRGDRRVAGRREPKRSGGLSPNSPQGGREAGRTRSGRVRTEPGRGRADVGVDAEDLLDHHDGAARLAERIDPVSVELVTVTGA